MCALDQTVSAVTTKSRDKQNRNESVQSENHDSTRLHCDIQCMILGNETVPESLFKIKTKQKRHRL